jgi:PTS system mannose-specific IID component
MRRTPVKINKLDLARVFFRSFLIQASWSFDRMQSLGFAFALEPVIRKLYTDGEEYRSRLNVHMEYFNTQPYLALFILGAAARLEEERASGRDSGADVSGLKNALMAPLGALGDSFFWGALKPLMAVIAAALVLTGAWWAPLAFLALYNAWHLWLRVKALQWGYESAGDAVLLMSRYNFTKMARLFKATCLAVLGGMLGMSSLWKPEFRPVSSGSGIVPALAGLLITLVLAAFLKKGASPVKILLGLAAVCVALAFAGVA